MTKYSLSQPQNLAGLFALAMRWVIGWTYFSAFWRRLILENKLIPDEAGYIGEKFNHFLPNALGIKPIIEYLVTHPEMLLWAMIIFTIVEAIVGLFIILGLYTRLMSLGVIGLAMGILLGSGWIGTTCLDEWQIGVLGVAGGFTIFLTGSGTYSLDNFFMKRGYGFAQKKSFAWLASGDFPLKNPNRFVLIGATIILALTLYTNQYFHGGLFGKLHNKSVRPKLEISNIQLQEKQLQFQVYRVEGADVYGSFLIGIEFANAMGEVIKKFDFTKNAELPLPIIKNHYVAKVKSSKYSMIIPLGAKADLIFDLQNIPQEKGKIASIKLIDISGLEWTAEVQ